MVVRFKVIKGSHLLLGIAIAVLTLVVGALILSAVFSNRSEPVSSRASLVQFHEENQYEAETNSVFASININSNAMEFDPGRSDALSIEIISVESQKEETDKPSVLIYHTHTHEAYDQVAEDRYVAIEAWRTNDHDHSVVRVGAELTSLLREYGFEVVHDTTDHELNELGTAYTRSLETLQSYPQPFDLYIDLHRDAYIEGVSEDGMKANGEKLAHVMMLIGNGVGFEVKPYYEENLAFAQALTERINSICPGLCKDVLVKDGRYNQNIGVFSILVEVGHNMNTLEEALNAVPYLAKGIYSLMLEKSVRELTEAQRAFQSDNS